MSNNQRLKESDILVPGAQLKAQILNENDPKLLENHRKTREAQKKILSLKNITKETLDTVIDI